MNDKTSTDRPDLGSRDTAVLIAVLEHARTMAVNASSIRQQNFNFFLIVAGAFVAAYAQVDVGWNARLIAALGVVVSILFIGLDVRGTQLLRVAQRQLIEVESLLGCSMQRAADQLVGQNWLSTVVTHTWIYRAIFGIAAVTFSILALWPT